MAPGRHRGEPVGPRGRDLRPPAIALGIGAVVLGTTLGAIYYPGADSTASTTAAAASDKVATRQLAAAMLAAPTPTPSATPTASVSPSAAKTTSAPKIKGQRWVTENVAVRRGPSTDDDRIAGLKAGAQADITGTTRNGWTQVVVDGQVGWVKSDYLATSESKAKSSASAKSTATSKKSAAGGSSTSDTKGSDSSAADSASAKSPSSSDSENDSSGVSKAKCSISSSIEAHLSSNARKVYRAVCAAHGDSVSSFGGYRRGDSGDHGDGHAVDIMVSGDPGKVIARYLQAHAKELGVTYVIYQQKIWMAGNPTTQWKYMADRGGATANHYDHVHVSVS